MPTTTKNRAPYRHADGSNCWTRNCSRSNKNIAPVVVKDPLSADIKAELDKAYKMQEKENVKKAKKQILPAKVVWSGSKVNSAYDMKSLLLGGYNSRKFRTIKNPTKDIGFTKPAGGLWISPVTHEISGKGVTAWQRLLGAYDDPDFDADIAEGTVSIESSVEPVNDSKTEQNVSVKFNSDAKIAVIDSLEDYRAILDRYPLYPDYSETYSQHDLEFMSRLKSFSHFGISDKGASKRNIDYTELSKNYDALLVTEKGLYACGKNFLGQNNLGNDVSLYMWDIPSAVIFNKNSFKVS
jgi:hypothetical protein